MSRVSIFFNPLDASSRQDYDIAPGTALIDWLQLHYPAGMGGALRVFVGNRELPLDDLDYSVEEFDQVTMLVLPAGDPISATLTTILIQVAVTVAISIVISMIFRPSRPDGMDGGDESPVYSINATRNRARLNEPIPSHYGTVSWAPDFAAAPYVFYNEASNDMFVDELLCIGHGEYTVSDVFVGDTPADSLEPGTLQYWLFGPDDHGQTLGTIEADILADVSGTPTPIPFSENIFTSPEVENWEFNKDENETPGTPAAISGTAVAASGGLPGYITGVSSSLDIHAGSTVTLASTTSNNITFKVLAVVVDPEDDTKMTLWETTPYQIANEAPLAGAATYVVDVIVNNMFAGPYRAQKIGQQVDAIDCDIVFPQGLMTVQSDGDQLYRDIQLEFTYQAINETTGTPIGSPTVLTKTYRAKTRRPLRDTFSSGPLTPGSYQVTVERKTDFAGRGLSPETTLWAGLKGHVVHDTEAQVYGPVTLMAIRMKATNGLGQAARSRVRVTARRVLASGESENPITIVKDIYTNTDYGMKRDPAELMSTELDALETEWDGVNGPRFNGSFDQRGTGWDAMQNVVSMAGAKVVQNNALVTVVQDKVQAVRTALFNSANIVKDTLEISYTFDTDGEFDGVEVEYRDPDTFDAKFVIYPTYAEQAEKFTLFGCTDADYAAEFARYLWNVRANRRRIVKFQTEMEGLIPRFGDRIGVSHPMPDWGESGVIVERIGALTYRVDRDLSWRKTDNNVILRYDDGSPTDPLPVTMGDHRDIIVFDSAPPLIIYGPSHRDPTVYSFGRSYNMVQDFIISRITPQAENVIMIEGQHYDEAVYTGAPAHMGG